MAVQSATIIWPRESRGSKIELSSSRLIALHPPTVLERFHARRTGKQVAREIIIDSGSREEAKDDERR